MPPPPSSLDEPHLPLQRFVLVFFDDILIYSPNLESHATHLAVVFNILQDNSLFTNMKKCQFARSKIEYMGHWVSAKGVEADPEKVRAMIQWPIPTNLKELWGFFGLTGCYRWFVENYRAIVAPLTQLLKKNAYMWSKAATKAFERLKRAMITLLVLALPDFSQPFVVEPDASSTGLGAILSQGQRPIAFFSQTLSSTARQKPVYERELMAIVLSVQHWRMYLLGQKFLVSIDQQALKFLFEQKKVTPPKYQRWVSKLLGYDFDIQYHPSLENKAVDTLSPMPPTDHSVSPTEALSRMPPAAHLATLTVPAILDVAVIQGEVAQDPELSKIIKNLHKDADSVPRFSLQQRKLLYKGHLVLSRNSSLISVALHTYHDSIFGGHSTALTSD